MLALPSFHLLLLLDYPPESFLYEARNVRGHKLFFVCEPLPQFKEHGLGCLFSSKVGHSCSRLESETSRCSPLQVLMGAEMSPKKNSCPTSTYQSTAGAAAHHETPEDAVAGCCCAILSCSEQTLQSSGCLALSRLGISSQPEKREHSAAFFYMGAAKTGLSTGMPPGMHRHNQGQGVSQ